eukprot:s94_g35.t2
MSSGRRDQCGCRVVQKAIGAVSKESQQQISRELEDHVDDCIRNMHGNHVIQKCIEQMPPESVNFIIRAVEQRAEETARHVYGCRVIQRLLEHCVSDQLKPMLEQILCNVAVLAKDAYGNYVIQHMLEHGRKEDKQRIIQTIRANIAEFSREKYSSNVVEKCFEISTTGEHADTDLIQQERASLLNTVLEVPEVLYTLCTNTYGNYVAQECEKQLYLEYRDLLSSWRLLNLAWSGLRGTCTASGAVGLSAFGLVICPYVSRRAPLDEASREALQEEKTELC